MQILNFQLIQYSKAEQKKEPIFVNLYDIKVKIFLSAQKLKYDAY